MGLFRIEKPNVCTPPFKMIYIFKCSFHCVTHRLKSPCDKVNKRMSVLAYNFKGTVHKDTYLRSCSLGIRETAP